MPLLITLFCFRPTLFGGLAIVVALFAAEPTLAQSVPEAKAVGTFEIPDALQENMDVSGIVLRNTFMLLAVDEGREIQVLERKRPGVYEIVETQKLLKWPEDTELDIEGLAGSQRFIYAIGSHSQKRKSIDTSSAKGMTAKNNRQRLYQTVIEPSREFLFRFEVEANGKIKKKKIKFVTLRDLFATHPILRRFQVIPGKENGVDIEGIAVHAHGVKLKVF